MPIFIHDRFSFGVTSKRQYTDEGFLKVPGHAARTGIQQYLAKELELTDRNPLEIVNVLRPPEEVFNQDSLESYAHKDVTDNHPDKPVDAKTHKAVTVGHVASLGQRDGDFVLVDLIVKDAETIKQIESGKVQLSAGYEAEYIHQPGKTEDGQEYEFIQRDIRINHVALVDKARAGQQARVFDHNKGGQSMPKFTLDNGHSVEVADEATVLLLNNYCDGLKKQTADAMEKVSEQTARAETLDAENEELKAKTNDAAISSRISEIHTTLDRAKKIAGADFTCDSIDITEIKRAALAKQGKLNVADQDATYIKVAFDMAEEKEVEDEDEEEKKKKDAKDSLDSLGKDFSKLTAKDAQTVRDASYDGFLKNRYATKEA